MRSCSNSLSTWVFLSLSTTRAAIAAPERQLAMSSLPRAVTIPVRTSGVLTLETGSPRVEFILPQLQVPPAWNQYGYRPRSSCEWNIVLQSERVYFARVHLAL